MIVKSRVICPVCLFEGFSLYSSACIIDEGSHALDLNDLPGLSPDQTLHIFVPGNKSPRPPPYNPAEITVMFRSTA
jgi:hypothetical protein